jgi:hypothetical protein
MTKAAPEKFFARRPASRVGSISRSRRARRLLDAPAPRAYTAARPVFRNPFFRMILQAEDEF